MKRFMILFMMILFIPMIYADLSTNLEIYYKFNVNSANQLDSSGNGNNGTISSATFIPSAYIDGGYSFTATAQNMASTPSYNMTNQFTVMFWSKIDIMTTSEDYFGSISGSDIIQMSYKGDLTDYAVMDIIGTGDRFRIISNDNIYPNTTTWVHVAFVRDGLNTGRIYINGVDDTNSITHATKSSGTVQTTQYIGSVNNVGGAWLNGDLDEFAIWSRNLSESEIEEIYNKSLLGLGILDNTSSSFDLIVAYEENGSESSTFLQGDDLLLYLENGTFGCYSYFDYNISIETEYLSDSTNMSLCFTGCDNDTYSFNHTKTQNYDTKDYGIHFNACQEFNNRYLTLNLSCASGYANYTIDAIDIPSCSSGFNSFFINLSVCENETEINMLIDSSSINPSNQIIISDVELDEYYDNINISYFYNGSDFIINQTIEYYVNDFHTINTTCGNDSIETIIEVGNVPPIFTIDYISSNCSEDIYDGSDFEYCSSEMTLYFSIFDRDKIKTSTIYFVCNNTVIGVKPAVQVEEYFQFNGSVLRDFSDFGRLDMFCNATAVIAYYNQPNIVKSFAYYINDTVSPICYGFSNQTLMTSEYIFDIDCYDESFYSFNITCDYAPNFSIDGLNVQNYNYYLSYNITQNTTCDIRYCDGHTKEKLDTINGYKLDDKTLFVSSYLGTNTLQYDDTGNISLDFVKAYDRYKIIFKSNEEKDKDKTKLKAYKFRYQINKGHYLQSILYKAWIIDSHAETWLDFNSPEVESYDVKTLEDGVFKITIYSYSDYIEFESIGELNCETDSFTLLYTPFIEPSTFQTNVCPTSSIPQTMLFSIIIIVGVILMIISLIYKMGIFNILSGLMFTFITYVIVGCNSGIGVIFGILAIFCLLTGMFIQRLY